MQLIYYPHDGLRQDCTTVDPYTVTNDLIKKMAVIMDKKKGIALAAPQIGLNKRFFVIKNVKGTAVFINPVITVFKGLQSSLEGCLSMPEDQHIVNRYDNITLRFQDINGVYLTKKFIGLVSACIQHEIDHLNGILFIDRINHE